MNLLLDAEDPGPPKFETPKPKQRPCPPSEGSFDSLENKLELHPMHRINTAGIIIDFMQTILYHRPGSFRKNHWMIHTKPQKANCPEYLRYNAEMWMQQVH